MTPTPSSVNWWPGGNWRCGMRSTYGTPTGMEVMVELVRPTDGLPAFAAAMVGPDITTRQRELWRTRDRACLDLFVPGKPARMEGPSPRRDRRSHHPDRLW